MGQFIFYLTFLSIWNFKSLSLFWNILFPWHLWYPPLLSSLYYGWLYTFPSSAHSLSYTRGYNLLLERARWVHINVPSYLLSVPACACTHTYTLKNKFGPIFYIKTEIPGFSWKIRRSWNTGSVLPCGSKCSELSTWTLQFVIILTTHTMDAIDT